MSFVVVPFSWKHKENFCSSCENVRQLVNKCVIDRQFSLAAVVAIVGYVMLPVRMAAYFWAWD